jgi:hypothetical protein
MRFFAKKVAPISSFGLPQAAETYNIAKNLFEFGHYTLHSAKFVLEFVLEVHKPLYRTPVGNR